MVRKKHMRIACGVCVGVSEKQEIVHLSTRSFLFLLIIVKRILSAHIYTNTINEEFLFLSIRINAMANKIGLFLDWKKKKNNKQYIDG